MTLRIPPLGGGVVTVTVKLAESLGSPGSSVPSLLTSTYALTVSVPTFEPVNNVNVACPLPSVVSVAEEKAESSPLGVESTSTPGTGLPPLSVTVAVTDAVWPATTVEVFGESTSAAGMPAPAF